MASSGSARAGAADSRWDRRHVPSGGARPRGLEGDAAEGPRERRARCAAPVEDRKEEMEPRKSRTSDIATLGQIERELCEVEEQLVGKKIAERLPVTMAAKSTTLAALERVNRARKELEEASRELLASLHTQGDTADSLMR